jgi:hypothetical protein
MLVKTVVESCLSEIERIWRQTPDGRKPWGVWIAYHQPIRRDADYPDTDVIFAWFLSNEGLQQRGACAYVRFRIVQSGKHWSSGIYPIAPSPVFGKVHQMNEIGLASFAAVQDEPLVYLDFLWGGTYGRGDLYRIEHCGKITLDSRIWIA